MATIIPDGMTAKSCQMSGYGSPPYITQKQADAKQAAEKAAEQSKLAQARADGAAQAVAQISASLAGVSTENEVAKSSVEKVANEEVASKAPPKLGRQISMSASGDVLLTEHGKTKKVDPGWLLATVLAEKRVGLTGQYVDLIQNMNDTNQEADALRDFMAKLRANKPDDSISASDFQTKIVNAVKVSHPDFDVNSFNWTSYKSDGKFTKDKISDMIEDVRNNITSKNNLNSQIQLKVKMTEMYRNETIEWQNTLYDHLGRVFEKVNQ